MKIPFFLPHILRYADFPGIISGKILPAFECFCVLVDISKIETAWLGIFGIVKRHALEEEFRYSVLCFIALCVMMAVKRHKEIALAAGKIIGMRNHYQVTFILFGKFFDDEIRLNGFIINLMSGTNGSVIKVGSGATLNLYDCHNNGMITGGTSTLDVDTTSTYGGGVYVDYDGYNDIDGEWFSPIYRLR